MPPKDFDEIHAFLDDHGYGLVVVDTLGEFVVVVRKYTVQATANADDRPADEIERADPALAGVAAQAFVEESADHVYIYTTDALAGEEAENAVDREGYGIQ